MKQICAKCARAAASVRIVQGLPQCSPACPAEQLVLLPITESEIRQRNLRYYLTGAL
jgi:hypothetical protein